jgi:hypothetical protein
MVLFDDWLASAGIMGKNLWLIPQFGGIIRCGVPGARSSAMVFAAIPISGSTSTRILSGNPARAMWSAATFLGLYRIRTSLICPYRPLLLPRWLDSPPSPRDGTGDIRAFPAFRKIWHAPPGPRRRNKDNALAAGSFGAPPCDPTRILSEEFIVPVCRIHHRELHRSGNEAVWWRTLSRII